MVNDICIYNIIMHNFDYSGGTSVCGAHSLHTYLADTSNNDFGMRHDLCRLHCTLHNIYRFHEQLGPLQLRAHSEIFLLSFPSS